jgi:hypothetical protein
MPVDIHTAQRRAVAKSPGPAAWTATKKMAVATIGRHHQSITRR